MSARRRQGQTSASAAADARFMGMALRLARRGYGSTSPNPMVGAVLVKSGKVIGRGWHKKAGGPHAEIEALRDAGAKRHSTRGAALYVTLEPCCTYGRTPPCTKAVIEAGIRRVVVGAVDPNPRHKGRAFRILRTAGVRVDQGILAEECSRLNEAFNHWIVQRTPFVVVKAGMTLDGKIATAAGESRWITGVQARDYGMNLRRGCDAILVGINTVLADDPSLTVRGPAAGSQPNRLRRVILDSQARTPLRGKVVSDAWASLTTVVVSKSAPKRRVAALAKRVRILAAPSAGGCINLRWLLRKLGAEGVTRLLVEGGGEVNASFLMQGLAQRVAFFYAPMILGGRKSRPAVAGPGAVSLAESLRLTEVEWQRLGVDWLLTARVSC